MNKLIKKIIKNKTHCFFISPHLDDAVLSAGELLSRLSGKVPVTVVNVFTKAIDDRPTLSARQFLKYSGYRKAGLLFDDRRKEDKEALHLLALSPVDLGYIEALWRKRNNSVARFLGKVMPEFAYVYPIYRFLITSGHVAKADKAVKDTLERKLRDLVGKNPNYLIFVPLGIGGHVDHWIVREVCEEIFGKHLVYWSDFPYNVRIGNVGECPKGYNRLHLTVNSLLKEKLIRTYKTQVNGLFSGGNIPKHEEIYFASES